MNNQIKQYQKRLFYKLFATLPSYGKSNNVYYFRNKNFWFIKSEKEDSFLFSFGIKDKPIGDLSGEDACLIIDFDKNVQFNNTRLGLFAIEKSLMHIFINFKLLKERYPSINIGDFNISNFKSFDNSIDLEVIDLGSLNGDFIVNLEKLINASYKIKSQKNSNSIKKESHKKVNSQKITGDSNNIIKINEPNAKNEQVKKNNGPKLLKVIRTDSFGNKNTISQMNMILEDLENGKNEDEAISHAHVSKNTYEYWLNRGKQDFGDVYIQFYKYVGEIKSKHDEVSIEEIDEKPKILADEGIYEPLLDEYEKSFSSMNQSGIAWVNKSGDKWIYSRNINGKTIELTADTIPELYEKVINQNLIWGIRDYERAKKFIDIPDDFKIPEMRTEDELDKISPDIYAPLPYEYEKSFSSMNQSGIAWVNQIGNKLYYMKSVDGKSIRLVGENAYDLFEKVKKANQIWGIRDYSKASNYIDIPKDFEIPEKPDDGEENEIVSDNEVNKSIYAPLSQDQLSKFNPNPNNKTGIAWVNKVGNNWVYQRQRNGKTVRIFDSNIIKLYEKVISNNQIWGIIDIDKAQKVIETNSIDNKGDKPSKIVKPVVKDSNVTINYIEKPKDQFEILIKGIIKNRDLINVLSRLDLFKENIKRIITTSINNESDIFIELEINKNMLQDFEEKIEDLKWKIIK